MHGRHIKVMGRGDPERLGSSYVVRTFLEQLVEDLGMRALGRPIIYEVEQQISKLGLEPFEDEGGVTGVVVLSTSHCAIHTWPLRSKVEGTFMFVADVFSCRDFDELVLKELLPTAFGAHSVVMKDLTASMSYP